MLQQPQSWAEDLQRLHPNLRRVGLFGSYSRGTASVGSDLDLLLIDDLAEGPQRERLLHWPLEQLPLSCDALVLTSAEFEQLIGAENRMAQELQADLRWLC